MSGYVAVIFRYRKANTYGPNVVLAALEAHRPSGRYAISLASDEDEVISQIVEALKNGHRPLVAWSFYSPGFEMACEELAAVKNAVPDSRVIHLAGGVHATAEPLVTLRSGFDLVAIGEGESTFINLVDALERGEDGRGLAGLAWLDGDGQMRRGAQAERLPLDTYPAFPLSRRLTNPIEITRGCIYACQFCQTPFMFQARFRHRSVPNVREHVQVMLARGLTDIRFITPTSLSYGSADESVNLDAIYELLSGVRQELGDKGRIFFGSFPSEVRPEHVTPEALRLLREYVANDNLIIGGQSGSESLLAKSNRGHGALVIEEAARIALQEGFQPNVDFIFGMPGETSEDAAETVKLAERLVDMGARIHGHTFMPLPGTPWRDEAPGEVSHSTLRALRRLTSQGGLYGSWERQRDVAEKLASARSEKRGYRVRKVHPRAPKPGR